MLERCGALIDHFGRLPDDPAATRVLYPAISFAGQVLSMMDLATPLEADRLRQRVEGALNRPDAMRGYLLELGTATHFARCGHKPQLPEMVGLGTFDRPIQQYPWQLPVVVTVGARLNDCKLA